MNNILLIITRDLITNIKLIISMPFSLQNKLENLQNFLHTD
jgi:hypothetical protein